MKHWAAAGLIIVLSLGVSLLMSEALTRVLFYRSMDFDMEFWKYATQIKVASDDPKLGFEHRPNRSAFLMGVNITTNQFALRGGDIPLEKPANTFRVVVIGDSLTLGWGVSQEDTFVARLERKLNTEPPATFPKDKHYEFLNLGVGNYNTVQEVERLRKTGLPLSPDFIILCYFINDAEPVPRPQRGFFIENSYLVAFVSSRLRQLPFEGGSALNYKDYYRGLYEDGQPGWQAAQSALADLVRIGQERKIPVLAFILPELHDLSENYPFADIDARLIAIGASLGLPVVDLYPVFRGFAPEQKLWVTASDAHPNALAHAMIADGIYGTLASIPIKP